MLNDHERKTLREVEHQFMTDDPEFTRSFEARQTRLSRRPHRLVARIALVTAALIIMLMLVAGSLGAALAFAFTSGVIWLVWRLCADADRGTQ